MAETNQLKVRLVLCAKTAETWATDTTVLLKGELGIESDTRKVKIGNGTNVLAAYGCNTGGPALLDFGLYIENKTYSEADTALLKQIDVQAAQTHDVCEC